jgi:stage II sporulation protein D
MIRKYISIYFLAMLIIMMSVTTVIKGSAGDYTDKDIRIGLKQYYEGVNSISVNNKTLVMGYIIEKEWYPEYTFTSNNGFIFRPATNYFLISKEYFTSYEDAIDKVDELVEEGYDAYVGNVSKQIWKVYVGNVASSSEINKVYNLVNNLFDLTYEKQGDNGQRTIMKYSDGQVLFENTFSQATFTTNDLQDNVTLIDLGKRKYRGKMEFGRYNKHGVTAINIIDIESYLYSVVPSEVIASWPIETLKAQAVAARNFSVYYTDIASKYPKEAYDLCDTQNSQVYKGYDMEYSTCTQAVNETRGELLYYGDSVIGTFYHSTSGGHTEDSQNVWSGIVPYLKAVPDIYETEPERKPWITSLSPNEIEEKLANYDVNIGSVVDVEAVNYSDSGRVMNLKITGTNGTYTIPKETIRYWLKLNSRKFTVVKSNYNNKTEFNTISANGTAGQINYNGAYAVNGNSNNKRIDNGKEQLIVMTGTNVHNYPMISGNKNEFIFAGEGWGHGVGLSQSGAKGMAKEGFTYKEILEYYFSGTEVR